MLEVLAGNMCKFAVAALARAELRKPSAPAYFLQLDIDEFLSPWQPTPSQPPPQLPFGPGLAGSLRRLVSHVHGGGVRGVGSGSVSSAYGLNESVVRARFESNDGSLPQQRIGSPAHCAGIASTGERSHHTKI